MTLKQYFYGMVGGLLGVGISVMTGLIPAIGVFALIGVIGGFIYAAKTSKDEPSKEEKARINLENYIAKYKNLLQNLPKEELLRLVSIVQGTMRTLGLDSKDTPPELSKMGAAAVTLINENKFGKIKAAQKSKVNNLLSDLQKELEMLTPILTGKLNQSLDNGLGFGVVGGAADVALHSIMDTNERLKNYRKVNQVTNKMIDEKITKFATDLQGILQ